MTQSHVETPVLIVGAGPAGLTTALLLSQYGVSSLILEKHLEVSVLPRARGVHSRAMEILRGLGIADDMRRHQLEIRSGLEWRADLTQPPVREVKVSTPEDAEVSPCDGVAVAQDVFESVLRSHLADGRSSTAGPRLRLGVELTSLNARDDGVTVTVLDRATGTVSTIDAGYLVAADGARSLVRRALGIPLLGHADLGSQQGIAFRAELEAYIGHRPRGMYFLTDSASALFSTHPDSRWAISTPDTEGPLNPVAMVRRVTGIPELPVEVIAASRWTAAAESAERYSSGRVFLVGDAAHQTPPVGATGVSTAMADAHNLSWKLAAVLDGRAGPALLDSYHDEREPVGRQNAVELGAAWLAMLSGGSALTGRSLRQIDMGYRYASAVVADEDDGAPPQAQDDYVPSAAPGCRAPHLWLDENRRVSTIDLVDRFPTLLTTDEGRDWQQAADTATRSLSVSVSRRTVDHADWPRLYGIHPSGAVLLRPDGHVAWRCQQRPGPMDTSSTELLQGALGRALALPVGSVAR